MDAYIVLHGFMLLSCPHSSNYCSILIADTPTHLYKAGFVGSMNALPSSVNNPLVTDLAATSSNQDPFNTSSPPPMKSRTLVLDGQPQKTTVNPNKAKYVIHVPIPDEIWGAHYSILKTSDAIDSTDPSLFESDVSGPTIRVPETLVLRYKGVSTPFKLKEGNSTRASSGQVFNSSGPAGNALVITSWPDCSMKPHSMNNFNLMIDSSKGNPSFHLTEIAADAGGDDVGISALPSSVLSSMPSCAFAAAKVSSKAGPAKKTKVPGGNETDQEVIFNVDATGCGIV